MFDYETFIRFWVIMKNDFVSTWMDNADCDIVISPLTTLQ